MKTLYRRLYADRCIVCRPSSLMVRGYYMPFGLPKRIRYRDIRDVAQVELGMLSGRFCIWGAIDPRHWFHLDLLRPTKRHGLVLDMGARVRPVITPDDPVKVKTIIESGIADLRGDASDGATGREGPATGREAA